MRIVISGPRHLSSTAPIVQRKELVHHKDYETREGAKTRLFEPVSAFFVGKSKFLVPTKILKRGDNSLTISVN